MNTPHNKDAKTSADSARSPLSEPEPAAEDDAARQSVGGVHAERIRAFREERGLSVRAVARRAGLSASLVSAVERRAAEPSITSLRKIAEVLGVSIFHLVDDRPTGGGALAGSIESQTVRRLDRRKVSLPGSGIRYELLCPDSARQMEGWIGTLQPGRWTADMERAHPGDELMLILSGSTELFYGEELVELHEGDSVYIDGTVPHRMRALGPRPLTFLSVLSPPAL